MDIIRVLRLIEYEGPRDWVEDTLSRAVKGTLIVRNDCIIRAATLGDFPSLVGSHIENRGGKLRKD